MRYTHFRHLVIRLLVLLAMVVPMASAQNWNWTTSQIDADGTDSWLALDHQGNVHVSYRSGGKLKYGFLPVGSAHWFTMVLEPMLGDFLTNIAVDPKGNPYVCYTPGVLKLAVFDGQRWQLQQIDPGSPLVSYYCSVRFGEDGVPQLSWYIEANFTLRHAVLRDGVWVVRTVDHQDGPGKFNSLVIDRSGNPQLSYIGLGGPLLKYARFTGQDWIYVILEAPFKGLQHSGRDTGMGNSIALDRDGNPMISYFDTSALKFVHLVDNKWKFQVVDRFEPLDKWGWRYFRTNTVLDTDGNPHIGYQGPLGLKHAWWDGSQWRTQVILAPAGNTFDGAMTMDGKNNLYYTYTDPVQRSLMLAVGRFSHEERTASSESSSKP
jgi:hypothetical protein